MTNGIEMDYIKLLNKKKSDIAVISNDINYLDIQRGKLVIKKIELRIELRKLEYQSHRFDVV